MLHKENKYLMNIYANIAYQYKDEILIGIIVFIYRNGHMKRCHIYIYL